jgi:hypothetical protein
MFAQKAALAVTGHDARGILSTMLQCRKGVV